MLGKQGGIVEINLPIDLSNIAISIPEKMALIGLASKPSKMGVKCAISNLMGNWWISDE